MWLTNLRILDGDRIIENGSVEIENGLFREIKAGAVPTEALDMHGLWAMPGFVDLHGDMLERELHPRPTAKVPTEIALHEVDKRLANSGITTAFTAISFAWQKEEDVRSEQTARELISSVNELSAELMVDHYVHTRFEITNPDAGRILEEFLDLNYIQMVSVMDHTPGQGQYRDIEGYISFMVEWSKRTQVGPVNREKIVEQIEHMKERPKGWEAVERVTGICRERGIPLASHDDDTVEKVELMAGLGVNICEFPITLEVAHLAKERGLTTLMGGPNAYRGASHNANLSAREATAAGALDALATDYYPPALVLAAFKLDERGILPIEKGIQLITKNPAEAVGMTDRGAIATGKRADLVLVEPHGWPQVRATFCAGIPVFCDEVVVGYAGEKLALGGSSSRETHRQRREALEV